jgi:hypothetical protein
MDMNDVYSSENDLFNNLMVKITSLDALDDDSESDAEDGFKVFDNTPRCFSGGARTSRPNRSGPRPFIPSGNRESQCRRNFGMDGEWGRIFFKLEVFPGSLAWDDFRVKFCTPLPLINYILEWTKESGKFSHEGSSTRGYESHMLCLQLSAYLRYHATCLSVSVRMRVSVTMLLQTFIYFDVFIICACDRFASECAR